MRDFRTFDDKPEWHGKTLFLDGLDESRAATVDGRTSLDDIRRKLERLGRPRFRLSCRWADWLAANDKDGLESVSPDGTVVVVRLEPLSERAIKDIVRNNHDVEDTAGFLTDARERGVDGLLRNPQNLDLLAKLVVARGKWPESRRETFEEACGMLASEPNGEHLAANPGAADVASLIEAAGLLCAAQLLSGGAGYTLPDRAQPEAGYPSLADVDGNLRGIARHVLGTRLFEGVSPGRLAPAHRQIAEFLAARHVSALLDAGLPLGRVLALMTAFDGELMPSFHNFVSWLAVHNKPSRKRLSHYDASGLIYAGDAETYSIDEKREIVRNLRREVGWNRLCSPGTRKVSGIGAIVSPDLEGTFLEILSDRARDDEHQSYVMLLMQLLRDGEPVPALAGVLLETMRDGRWAAGVRHAALEVLTGYADRGEVGHEPLAAMAADIRAGKVDDPGDHLLGGLLKWLYPKVLSVTDVLGYLRAPTPAEAPGEFARFWTEHVPTASSPDQLSELLDGIAASLDDYRPFMEGRRGLHTRMGLLPVKLLNQFFRDRDAQTAPHRLYDWLGVVSDPDLRPPETDRVRVRADLQWNRDALKAVIAYGVERCIETGEECAGLVDRRFLGVRPFDYGHWCLEMALGSRDVRAASFYLSELFDALAGGAGARGLTLNDVRARLAGTERLLRRFEDIARRREGEGAQSDADAAAQTPRNGKSEVRRQTSIAAGVAELTATPAALHRVAQAYLGTQGELTGETAEDRLRSLAGGSNASADFLRTALEKTIERRDLPACDDVVRMFDKSRVHSLVLPFAAALHSLEQSGRLSMRNVPEDRVRLAVTILYTLPQHLVDPASTDGTGTYRPDWFRTLLRENPGLVADVLCRTAAQVLASGVRPAIELRELAEAEDHGEVARLAALPILERFPRAKTEPALLSLRWALHAAFASGDWCDVARVIDNRLSRRDLSAGERGCWLAAGYFTAPERYGGDLRALASDVEGLKWLVIFTELASNAPLDLARRLTAGDIELLVTILGAAFGRDVLTEKAFWSGADLIAKIGTGTDQAARTALGALEEMPEAEPWLPVIKDAKDRQERRRREEKYRHCDIGSVVETLANRRPANPADLTALVLEELEELARRTRDGSTSDWRQHWNLDRYKAPIGPRPEDACRDTVLSDLKLRIQSLGIDAQPEGVYADDKLADIRVSFAGFNVPVEIKRSSHRDVWTAVENQLIPKYTRDPGAAGYGIYLVLWFGDTEMCPATKCDGWSPETADDVRRRLEESLSEEQRRLISTCVVDVSVPADGRRLAG